jgi:hypothetical protein
MARAFAATGRAWVRFTVYAFWLLLFFVLLVNAMLA